MALQQVTLATQIFGYYRGTKAAIEATGSVPEGSIGYATDTNEFGSYNGTTWTWGQGGVATLDELTDVYVPSPSGGEVLTYDEYMGLWVAQAPGTGSLPNPFALTADISPTALTADVDDYNPAGLSTADVLRLEASGAIRSITGLAGGADGRIIIIFNIGSFIIYLIDASSSSAAANRFEFERTKVVAPGNGVILQYDATISRWRAIHPDASALQGAAIEPDLLSSLLDNDLLIWNAGGSVIQRTNIAYLLGLATAIEAIQDIIGAMFSGNTESGIAATYQDADGTIDLEANALLASKSYIGTDPTTASGTVVDADATNLIVTFTTPASGNVLVRLTAMDIPDNGASHPGAIHSWGIREGTTPIFAPRPVSRDPGTGYTMFQAATAAFEVTGLTPGDSHSYKWTHLVTASGAAVIGASTANGPAIMEVWALP
jgi:hypothetical protein